jgi:lipoprotein-releasing system permease protein
LLWLGLPIAVAALVLYLSSAVFFVQRGGGENLFRGITYKAFVAQRYLLVAQPKVTKTTKWVIVGLFLGRFACQIAFGAGLGDRSLKNPIFDLERMVELSLVVAIVLGVLVHSRPALYTFFFGLFVSAVGSVMYFMAVKRVFVHFSYDDIRRVVDIPSWYGILTLILMAAGGILSGLALFFGFLRAFFTFFTTVPIGGVWIGTGALVCVLAVMSGFETDLREKILGSNAHIQVTTSDTHVGDFTEWRDVTKKIMAIPGVVASTPYGVSEVVIASNNNGLNVIIKGIDPKTVGNVTELVGALEDKKAINDLDEKVDPTLDLHVKEIGKGSGGVDPAPADLPSSADPIDYSGANIPDVGSGSASGVPDPGSGSAKTIQMPIVVDDVPQIEGPNDGVLDPPPPDLVTSDSPPIDYSKPRTESVDPQIHILDIPPDSPSVMKRTESLPGILVGRELVKQMHLYVGQEVRLVSPLSDPSNPDATGTPIPFNRDYRIAGIFFTGMYEYDLKFVYVTNDSLQAFLDRGDTVDGIEIRIPSPDDTDEYVKTIQNKLGPNYRVQDWKELNRSLFSALKLEKIAMFLVLGIVILVASFSIVGNLIMVVVEKQREIALLKTLGASDAGIMQLFAIQGLLIGLIGTLLGVATGLAACYVGKRIGIPLNPDVYYIDQMPVNVDPQSVALTFGAGVIISILATFYPALLGARVRPATGMRH